LKAKADSADVKLTEGEQLQAQVTKLTEAIALKERDERVSKAISAGKILPAQKEWADGYAYKDPQGFDAFVESAPKAIELGERGIQGNEPEEVQLTEMEKKVAEQMGISTEVLINAKKEVR
jgi:phage I-like protein